VQHYAPKHALPALLAAPLLFELRLPLPKLLTLLGGVTRPHASGDLPQGVVEAPAYGCVPDSIVATRTALASWRGSRRRR
jgi:hypothetical protein